jgi:hypothetical protein
VVQSARQDIDFPTAMGVNATTTYGTTGAAAISLRFNTPPGDAMVELGSVATRPALDGGWWMRYELGLRFSVGRR